MRLSIRAKLFLTLLLAAVLAVVGTQAFVHWSFLRGLEELAEARAQEHIGRIGDRLAALYARDGDWSQLQQDRRLWLGILFEDARLPPRLRQAFAEPGPWPPDPRMLGTPGADAPGADAPGGNRRPGIMHPQRLLPLRIMLLDVDDAPIYGRAELLDQARRYPLTLDGQRIGSLAVLPGPGISDAAQRRFRERQGAQIWVIALGMLVLAALLALPAAALLTRPVTALQRTARRLATGDYQARAPSAARDELGRLAQDLNALAETLQRNQAARQRWVADIAHELRTPLGLLQANIEALQDGLRRPDAQTLAGLLEDVLRLGRLVDDLNELTRTEPGTPAYHPVPVDLDGLLADLIDGHRARFARAGLRLSYATEGPGPWTLYADPDRLAQLIGNLLNNSLAYTDSGQPVALRLTRARDQLLIRLDDGPPGLPEDALPQLFERLYRVEASRNRRTGGAGLGLAIARNIVEAHGGEISAEHASLGGLGIRIRLPALESASASTAAGPNRDVQRGTADD
ncbi:HAMP domain-containing protein [Thiohalocapsa marina]|uniref:histidine kinase n=1 Tax=Thiohalocapsa marina TaxID=424902 RepID=A0A5M8FPY7_9GAMM|nr:HAMP domain-containing protein [Thiohalocapsa marina]